MKWVKGCLVPAVSAVILVLMLSRTVSIHYLLSGSMAPAYPEGSVMVMTTLLEPTEGSICIYRHNGRDVVHRIIEETESGYIFKGDANNVADPYEVKREEIEGRLIFGFPFLLTGEFKI